MRRIQFAGLALAVGLALAILATMLFYGPADAQVSQTPPNPSPTSARTCFNPNPPPCNETLPGDLHLTNADDGRTFTVGPGRRLDVVLTDDTNFYRWSVPASSNESVVRRDLAAQYPNGAAEAAFTAVAEGQAVLTATGDPHCATATPPCLAPSRTWQVTINVGDTSTRTSIAARKSRTRIRIFGSVTPNPSGGSVRISLSKRSASGFRRISSKTASLSASGDYAASFRRPARGGCRFVAWYNGDANFLPSRDSLETRC